MDLNDTRNRWIAGAIVVILIIGAWYLGRSQGAPSLQQPGTATSSVAEASSNTPAASATSSVSAPSAASMGAPTEVSNGSVTVHDQPAGMTVAVASVTLPQRGWVAVRDSNGRTLGAGLFPAGTSTNVTVDLLRGTVGGERYQVLLYIDNGDKQFSLSKDILITDADGSVAGTTFTTQ